VSFRAVLPVYEAEYGESVKTISASQHRLNRAHGRRVAAEELVIVEHPQIAGHGDRALWLVRNRVLVR